jgi:hypothetical protein
MGLAAIQAALLKRFRDPDGYEGAHVDIDMTAAVVPLNTIPFSISQTGLSVDILNVLNGRTAANYAVYGRERSASGERRGSLGASEARRREVGQRREAGRLGYLMNYSATHPSRCAGTKPRTASTWPWARSR